MINLNLLSSCLRYSDTYICRLVPVKKVHWDEDTIKYIIRIYSYTKEEKLGISYTLGIISINNTKEGMIRYNGKINIKVLYRIMSQGVRLEWRFLEGAENSFELMCKNIEDTIGYKNVGSFQKETSRVKQVRTREEILASKNARVALDKLFN